MAGSRLRCSRRGRLHRGGRGGRCNRPSATGVAGDGACRLCFRFGRDRHRARGLALVDGGAAISSSGPAGTGRARILPLPAGGCLLLGRRRCCDDFGGGCRPSDQGWLPRPARRCRLLAVGGSFGVVAALRCGDRRDARDGCGGCATVPCLRPSVPPAPQQRRCRRRPEPAASGSVVCCSRPASAPHPSFWRGSRGGGADAVRGPGSGLRPFLVTLATPLRRLPRSSPRSLRLRACFSASRSRAPAARRAPDDRPARHHAIIIRRLRPPRLPHAARVAAAVAAFTTCRFGWFGLGSRCCDCSVLRRGTMRTVSR